MRKNKTKNYGKSYPMFGYIDRLILKITPKVHIGDKISFKIDPDNFKEVFQLYGLDPTKYTLFDSPKLKTEELIPLLTHVTQTHETRLNTVEIDIQEIKKKIT